MAGIFPYRIGQGLSLDIMENFQAKPTSDFSKMLNPALESIACILYNLPGPYHVANQPASFYCFGYYNETGMKFSSETYVDCFNCPSSLPYCCNQPILGPTSASTCPPGYPYPLPGLCGSNPPSTQTPPPTNTPTNTCPNGTFSFRKGCITCVNANRLLSRFPKTGAAYQTLAPLVAEYCK